MIKKYFIYTLLLCCFNINAQEHFPKNDGVTSRNTNYTAFTHAKIYITPTQIIDEGTLLIKDGKVVASGKAIPIPDNAVIIDISGNSIYPSFIDLYSGFGIKKPKRLGSSGRSAQFEPTREGFYWNDHVMPEQNGIDTFKFDGKSASELRKAGFGVVNSHLQDGIVRGTGVLVALTDEGGNSERIIDDRSAQYLSLNKSVRSRQSYPTSIMGALALLRQMYYDADWYAKGQSNSKDRSLEALNANSKLVQIISAGDKANAVRVDKVGDSFGIQYVILGGGNEYERIDEIKATGAAFILPVNFPKAYDVEDPYLVNYLELETMREWNQRPSNPKVLADKGIPFALTTHQLKSTEDFKDNLMKALNYGLDKTKALEALTVVPAQILGKSSSLGSLKNGAYANFLITSGEIFNKETILYENWVKGHKHSIENINSIDIRGDYTFNIGDSSYEVSISGKINSPKAKVKSNDRELSSKLSYSDNWLNLTFRSIDSTKQEFMRMTSKVTDNANLSGKLIFPDGSETSYVMKKVVKENSEDSKKSIKQDSKLVNVVPLTYPNGAYGFSELPRQETILFKNATVWTNEKEGILKNTDVLIRDGKIAAIGPDISPGKAKLIDASGKHLTAGIIDEHTHIGISGGGNEAGHNSSAEVSIEDVINPEDIGIYRNLAGGVTSMQVLHGSSNPIGGRSAIVKLKWGESADNLRYKNAPKFIKFALGENVKQSNWQSFNRFPQTRMGVEQLYVDYFTRAKAYDAKKKSGEPFRKDIEMEVLGEILNKERFITCHSYVQSEINMLMKVAEQFNFNVNTFTHILEGYKVADKMEAHGVGASTFSDWWAYKYEVNDAIPYNAAIMHNKGVVTAINSDDSEMSRRLNQEAAKSIKYGGITEEDAWKFVTLNPARLLHIDDRVGSIKVGKDADVVLWSDHPMSVYAKAEKTFVEGALYFDIERDKELRRAIKKERNELINMMLEEKNKGSKTQAIKKEDKQQLHCDSL